MIYGLPGSLSDVASNSMTPYDVSTSATNLTLINLNDDSTRTTLDLPSNLIAGVKWPSADLRGSNLMRMTIDWLDSMVSLLRYG